MSSWTNKNILKKIRLGYYQPNPFGTFLKKSLPPTIVSAYYEMSSKYPKENYRTWIRLFLENCQAHIIFFCEESFKPFVEDCRKNFKDRTNIQILDRKEWTANTEFSNDFWEKQHLIDSEKSIHSVDLYKVWYEKKEFIKRAIALNPWKHTDFVWADAGLLRSQELCNLVKDGFPYADRIPTDRILLSNIGQFTENDSVVRTINGIVFRGDTSGKMRIDAKLIAGSIESWNQYDKLYESILDKYINAKIFLAKDQTIMATLVLEHPNTVSLVEPKPIGGEPWFYLILWLGAAPIIYNKMISDSTNTRKHTYTDLLKYIPILE
jgi:hypothetical protein